MLEGFSTVIMILQVLSALVIIGLVLLQHGKGADMGAAFGSGASGSLFGASGSSNFLSKSTAISVVIFFCSTITLTYLGSKKAPSVGVMDVATSTKVVAPAANSVASAAASIPTPVATQAASAIASTSTDAKPTANDIPK